MRLGSIVGISLLQLYHLNVIGEVFFAYFIYGDFVFDGVNIRPFETMKPSFIPQGPVILVWSRKLEARRRVMLVSNSFLNSGSLFGPQCPYTFDLH